MSHREFSQGLVKISQGFSQGGRGKEIEETVSRDMFDLEEIKEIADYLMVYYQAHINGD